MRNKIRFLAKNLFFFIFSKGVAFLAPILLVKFIALEDYGEVEFAYSIGSVVAVLLMLGLSGAYPYFILKREEKRKEQCFFFYGYFILFLFLVAAIVFYAGYILQATYFVFLFSAIFALQRLYSSILKSNDKGYIGVLYDGGYYFLLTFIISICLLLHVNSYILFLRIGMEVYLGGLIILFCVRYRRTKTAISLRKEYREIIRYSVPLILSGIIVFWLTSSARIYIRYLLGYEKVGIYSLYFRYVGISVIIYLFCYITFFKRLYLTSAQKLDKYFMALMLVICSVCFLFYFFYPWVSGYLLGNTGTTLSSELYMLLVLQMPLWVGISLNEGIISRENIVNKMNFSLGILVVLFPLVLWLFRNSMTLEFFTYLNVVLFGVAFLLQCRILKTRAVRLNRCVVYAYVSIIVASVYYFFF